MMSQFKRALRTQVCKYKNMKWGLQWKLQINANATFIGSFSFIGILFVVKSYFWLFVATFKKIPLGGAKQHFKLWDDTSCYNTLNRKEGRVSSLKQEFEDLSSSWVKADKQTNIREHFCWIELILKSMVEL